MQLKRIFALGLLVFSLLTVAAQPPQKKFDPKKFEAELEQYITTHAGFTPQEAAKFFPLYREMRRKQFSYFRAGDRFRFIDFSDEKQCEEAIRSKDKREIEIKELQQDYHRKFLRVLPASKVLKALRAEDRFHRQSFDKAVKRRGGRRPGPKM